MRRSVAMMCLFAAGLLDGGIKASDKSAIANSTATKPSSAKVEPADNSYCYVCHVNYQEEPLARQHELAGVGCEKCHGLSAKHSADEDNLTAPDLLYSKTRVAPFCLSCHPKEKLALDANHQSIFASGAPPQRCTDCHGEHRLKNRTRRWDKDTGKLTWKDSGPVMDRPLWYQGDKVAASRVEAWEFIVGGGAGFNHLNGLFTVENPTGKTPENERVLRALGNLKRFVDGFDFVRMAPDKGFLVSGVSAPQYHRALSEPGKQYALYLHHSSEKVGGSYTVIPGHYQEELVLKLPEGHYRADWVDPETGSVINSVDLVHEGGNRALKTPAYRIDLALAIKRL